jgi:DNA-directed RNA polymerase alpha subunit
MSPEPKKTIALEQLRARVAALRYLGMQLVKMVTDLRDAIQIDVARLDVLDSPEDLPAGVEELDLSVRAHGCLLGTYNAHPIKTIAELVNTPCSELLKIKNMGIITVAEVQALLEQRGLTLRDLPHAQRFDKYLRRERERVAEGKALVEKYRQINEP